MIESLLTLFSNNVIYPLIIPGLMAGSISILFSFFIPSALSQYKIPFLIGGIIAVLFFTFNGGKYMAESRWQLEKAEMDARIAKLNAQSSEVTVETVIKYVDKIKVVEKVRTEYVNVYVDTFLPPSVVDAYGGVPNGFVRLHDSAARNEVPGTPNDTDGASSKVGIDTVAKTVTSNYMTCHKTEEQLMSLQSWIRQQQQLYK